MVERNVRHHRNGSVGFPVGIVEVAGSSPASVTCDYRNKPRIVHVMGYFTILCEAPFGIRIGAVVVIGFGECSRNCVAVDEDVNCMACIAAEAAQQ